MKVLIIILIGIIILAIIEDGFIGFIKSFVISTIGILVIGAITYKVNNINDVKGASIVMQNDSTYIIPFTETNVGAKMIKLNINGVIIKALFDTGCTKTIAFSPSDYNKLIKNDIVEEGKFTNVSSGTMANGEEINAYEFILNNINIGETTINNLKVYCLEKADLTLIGIPLFNQFSSFTIDNENNVIICKK